MRYNARALLSLPDDELWAIPEGDHEVEFADGVKTLFYKDIINSTLLWYPLVQHPEVPILTEYAHDVDFTGKSMLDAVNAVCWGINDYHDQRFDPELLAMYAANTVNRWCNTITVRCSEYAVGMCFVDILEVADHPEIVKANKEVEPTRYSIEDITYPRIAKVLKGPDIAHNPVALGIRCGTQNMDQVMQCFGPVGFRTDFNSDIFKYPVLNSVVHGIWNLHDSMIESRSGTKSLIYNKELLRSTEYFNRKMQLISQYVKNIHHNTDCGTPYYLDVPVFKGLLKQMRGKYYLREDGKLDWLRGNETHLINTTIKIRGVLGCVHPDPQGVCSVCYGRMSYSIPYKTNVGQVSAVNVGDKITSKVLSTKHTDVTSKIDKFVIYKNEARFMRYGKREETLYLRQELKHRPFRIILDKNEAMNLSDILAIKDLSGYPVTNATSLTKIGIQVDTDEGRISEFLTVSLYNRKSSLSKELLEFIQKRRWTVDARDNIVIELTDFDVDQPFLVLPNKHVNMYEVMKRIKSFLHSGDDNDKAKNEVDPAEFGARTYLKNYRDPVDGLMVFASLLNEKLSVNFVHCEILVYAMMVRSAIHHDYRLPKPGIHGAFEKYTKLMYGRSAAGGLAFEKQDTIFNNPGSFTNKNVMDHPYDAMIMGRALSVA